MSIERDHDSQRLVLLGVGQRLPDDLLMPEMYAIENSDGDADLSPIRFQLSRLINDAHGPSLCGRRSQGDTERYVAANYQPLTDAKSFLFVRLPAERKPE